MNKKHALILDDKQTLPRLVSANRTIINTTQATKLVADCTKKYSIMFLSGRC